ncbi:MAG: right-handed parallel beta-helix repeat-containing protein, partial [Candidatus Margulisbacteria bacterium]|nr:right-handed parallel beta-helix repeat-containing protein [Candidatus Margulisiibacteriota bacterium]
MPQDHPKRLGYFSSLEDAQGNFTTQRFFRRLNFFPKLSDNMFSEPTSFEPMPIMKYLKLLIFVFVLFLFASAVQAATITSAASGYWNDTGTWVGSVIPSSTDSIVISSGHEVLFDRNDSSTTCGPITVNSGGTLKFDSGTKTMQVKGDINVYGKLELVPGSTLKIECETNGQYGIIVYSGGELKGTGSVPTVLTTLSAPLAIGGQTITVANASGFGVGDIITLGEGANAEGFTISAISGTTITLNRKALNAQTAGIEVYKNATVITSDISAGSKTFTVVDLGGIVAGDRIAVATTSSNYYETELATVESVSSNTITMIQPLLYSHDSGAIVVKTNRDTLITSAVQNGEHNGYIKINEDGMIRLEYVEVSYQGTDTYAEHKWGVYIEATSYLNPLKACSVHSTNYSGIYYGNIYTSQKGISLVSNIVYKNKDGAGIWTWATKGSSFISNFVFLNESPGISVSGVKDLLISNVTFSNTSTGLNMSSDKGILLYNETFSNSWGGELGINNTNNTLAAYNRIRGNHSSCYDGLLQIYYSNNIVLLENQILQLADFPATQGIYFIFEAVNVLGIDNNIDAFYGFNLGWNNKVIFKNSDFSSVNVREEDSYVVSLNRNNRNGIAEIWGDYHIPSSDGQQFNYVDRSYLSSATNPILFRGSNHTITTPEASDSTTATEVWFVTYRSATSNWEVKGTVSGLQSNRATSGALYTSDGSQVRFTLSQNSPQEGDQFVFAAIAAAGDANTQKRIMFGPSAIAELNNQSRLTVDSGGKIELKGTSTYPTLVDYDGIGAYGFVISGEVDAQYFDFNQINSDGVKIDPTATITKFDNGSIRNVSGLGPHLSVNGKDHTFNYLNIDNTGAYDVKASNDADLIFTRSQRGTFSDSIADTSSVSWDDPILGYTDNYIVGSLLYDSDTKILTIPYKIKDPNSFTCTFKNTSFQYSQDGGLTWRTVSDSNLSGIGGSFASSDSFGSAPQHTIYWNTGTNYNNLEANLAVRFRVNNGYVYGNYGTSEVIPFNIVPPVVQVLSPNGGELYKG